jgi:hypothetical protein
MERERIHRRLLQWYRHRRRPLLWRQRSWTPYEVLVREVMLQQTQSSRVEAGAARVPATLPDAAGAGSSTSGGRTAAVGWTGVLRPCPCAVALRPPTPGALRRHHPRG